MKLSIHILEPTLPWMEPTGLFDFSNRAWDEVIIVSTVGASAVMIVGQLFTTKLKVANPISAVNNKFNWLVFALWALGILLASVMISLNEIFDIIHSPIPSPVLNWPWPLQGFFSWYVGGGVFLTLAIPLYLDITNGNQIRAVLLITITGVSIAISIYSRGTVVFQSLIILVALFVYHNFMPSISTKKIINILIIIILGIVVSVVISGKRRELFLDQVKQVQQVKSNHFISSYSIFLILNLPIERWIGLEGVMAMTAYPKKNNELLVRAIKEKRVSGLIDSYTHDIALSPSTDTKTVIYATPPSLFAFCYYSGSKLILFIGVLIFTSLLLGSETLILRVSKNPFLASAVGIGVAIQLLHLGTGGLLEPAKILITSLLFALIISFAANRCMVYKKRVNDANH